MANETEAGSPRRPPDPGGAGSRAREPVTALTVEDAAGLVGGRVEGEAGTEVSGVAPVGDAGPGELAFLADRRYLDHLPGARALAVLVPEELAGAVEDVPSRIVVDDPRAALAVLLERFHPPFREPAAIHPTAVVEDGAGLGEDVAVGPYAVIGRNARVGDGAWIGPHTVVGAGCRIGEGSVLHPHVTLYPGVRVGDRVVVHAGARIGSDGFGWYEADGRPRKIPQVGTCEIGDDVEIGANTCVDRGSIGRTVIGPAAKLDNLVQVGHNVEIGAGALVAAQVGIAGSSSVGEGARVGGQAGISGHLKVGAGVRIGGQAGVIGDVGAGETVSGYPARPHGEQMRALGALRRLPGALKRLRALEERVEALAGSGADDAGTARERDANPGEEESDSSG